MGVLRTLLGKGKIPCRCFPRPVCSQARDGVPCRGHGQGARLPARPTPGTPRAQQEGVWGRQRGCDRGAVPGSGPGPLPGSVPLEGPARPGKGLGTSRAWHRENSPESLPFLLFPGKSCSVP